MKKRSARDTAYIDEKGKNLLEMNDLDWDMTFLDVTRSARAHSQSSVGVQF